MTNKEPRMYKKHYNPFLIRKIILENDWDTGVWSWWSDVDLDFYRVIIVYANGDTEIAMRKGKEESALILYETLTNYDK